MNLVEIIDLGHQAITSTFPKGDESDPPTAPLVLVRCHECGLVQLRDAVQQNLLYTYDYGYRSSVNTTMTKHLNAIGAKVEQTVGLKSGDIVLDIGCNDGCLLKSYRTDAIKRIGIDPIAEHFREDYPDNFHVVENYFSADVFDSVANGPKARAITSIAMFYDLPDPNQFVDDIASCLASDGVWFLEQSYMPTMLENTAFDTICHEHLEYYGLDQVRILVEKYGLRIFDVELNATNGGSFCISVCHQDASYKSHQDKIDQLLAKEHLIAQDDLHAFRDFAMRAKKARDELSDFIHTQKNQGKSVYIYGASTKGNTLLQYCKLNSDLITAAAERNPEKYGRRTPATGIPIISEEEVRKAKPDFMLVLPWHFRDEFLERESEYMEGGGHLIFPLPTLSVI